MCQRHYGIAYRRGTLPPKQLMLGIHSLSNVDHDARTADCAVCGLQVPIRVRTRKARGGIECAAKVEEHRRKGNRKPGREARARYRLRKKYKITQDDYDRMVADQQGRCAICHSEPPKLSVDHDHATGAVRGLLCTRCNIGLGFMRDDISLLNSAARYLMINSPL
jgi:hypothetical protein